MSTSRVFTVGQVLTAAQMNDLPQGVLGQTKITADVGPTSGTIELDVITAPAVTIAGTTRRLRVTFHARSILGTVALDVFTVQIKEGATMFNQTVINFASGVSSAPADFAYTIDSPTAGSHTYKVTIQRSSGTGTATVQANATFPILLTVEDVGQV